MAIVNNRQITPTRLVGYMQAHRKMAITSSFLGIFNFLNRWDEVRTACPSRA
jgi:hypothetical protein